jgi:putative ABC transport system substrate-binding protein
LHGVEVSVIEIADMGEAERAVTELASGGDGGLIVLSDASALARRRRIIALAARLRLPAIYAYRFYATSGGLMSYGPDTIDVHRRAAAYVNRILRGEEPAELPVQLPSRYQLVINRKTAKALGLEVPAALIDRASEVIE